MILNSRPQPFKNRFRLLGAAVCLLALVLPLLHFITHLTSWSFTGSLHEVAEAAQSVTLADGRVLLVGSTCELFDPKTSQWKSTAPMDIPMEYYRYTVRLPDDRVFSASHDRYGIYDPAANTWTSGKLLHPYGQTAQVTMDGHILVIGSRGQELIDPHTGTSKAIDGPTVTDSSSASSAPLPNHRAIVFFGNHPFIYDMDTLEFRPCAVPPIPSPWFKPRSMKDGRVFCLGSGPIGLEAIYNPDTDKWTALTDPDAAFGQSVTSLPDGKLLIIGGFKISRPSNMAILISRFWGMFIRTAPVYSSTGMGSVNFSVLSTCRLFDPATNTFHKIVPLNIGRTLHATALLADGRILVAGGRTKYGSGGGTKTCEVIQLRDIDP